MKAIKSLLLGLAAVLVIVTQVTANRLPEQRPHVLPYQQCETTKVRGSKATWVVRICKWGTSTQLPKKIDVHNIMSILQSEHSKDELILYTTVIIEPNNSVINPKFSGAYLPATGNILVQYPYDDDISWMLHVIAHELLHALWDVQGVDFGDHHRMLYCDGPLDKVDQYLETRVDPTQIPYFAEREWVHSSFKVLYCAEGALLSGTSSPSTQ